MPHFATCSLLTASLLVVATALPGHADVTLTDNNSSAQTTVPDEQTPTSPVVQREQAEDDSDLYNPFDADLFDIALTNGFNQASANTHTTTAADSEGALFHGDGDAQASYSTFDNTQLQGVQAFSPQQLVAVEPAVTPSASSVFSISFTLSQATMISIQGTLFADAMGSNLGNTFLTLGDDLLNTFYTAQVMGTMDLGEEMFAVNYQDILAAGEYTLFVQATADSSFEGFASAGYDLDVTLIEDVDDNPMVPTPAALPAGLLALAGMGLRRRRA